MSPIELLWTAKKAIGRSRKKVPIMPKMWVLTGGKYIERGEGKEEFAAKVPNWR